MKFTLSTIALTCFLSTGAFAQTYKALANVKENIILFAESTPEKPYRHLGSVTCARVSPEREDQLLDHMIKQAQKEYEEFDALMFRSGSGLCKADVIQYYAEGKKRRGRGDEQIDTTKLVAKPMQRGGRYIFVQNTPMDSVFVMGLVEAPVTQKSGNVEILIKDVLKVANEKYSEYDALVFVPGSNMRTAKVVQLIARE